MVQVKARMNRGKAAMPRVYSRPVKSEAAIPQPLQNSLMWGDWRAMANEASTYFADTWPKFSLRDENYEDMLLLRHGLIAPNIPPSHKEIVQNIGTKKAGELLARLVAILTAAYPEWTFHRDGMTHAAGLRASQLSAFWRSFWLGIEDKGGVPIIRTSADQQLGYGGTMFKVHERFDRWAYLPTQRPDESDKDFGFRLRGWKANNLPFDITIPEYNTLYYDLSSDGLVRVLERTMASAFELAAQFGGRYDSASKTLSIPVEYEEMEEDEDGMMMMVMHSETIRFKVAREVLYTEYWKLDDPVEKTGHCVYVINDTPVRCEHFSHGLPFFLALGEVTSSPDPGRMGLPILYNAAEDFLRLNNLRAMEDSFLWKHGYARLKHKLPMDAPGAVEPDLPDQEEEEEEIGEVLETKGDEDWAYMVPANVSALFADAKQDAKEGINEAAMADILTGRMPPSGTTGFLLSQLMSAAVSKYVPILQQQARAIRGATLFMQDTIDAELQSEVIVYAQGSEAEESAFIAYRPGFSRGNHNLDIEIAAPLPSDEIAKAQFLVAGNERGYIARETVQRKGYGVKQPGLEDEKINLDNFEKFYQPIAMLRSMQRAGQMEQVLEAARMGLLPGALGQLAEMFAQGPEGLSPNTPNPNGVIQAAPGLGEPGVPTVGAQANAAVVPGGGRAAGAPVRPGGPSSPAQPMSPGQVTS